MTGLVALVEGAIERGDWSDALELLDAGGDAARTAEMLELRAQAAYRCGSFEAAIAAWEDQHALLWESGELAGAARAAAMVAMFLMIDTGLMSPVRGWLRRAERLLDGQDDGPVHAVVATVRAYERFMCGDMASARRHADLAVGLGQRLGNQAAEVIGRTAGARITILEGRVDEGLEQLGEGEGEGEFVFTRADGKPIHPDFFSQSWQRLVRESGLRRSGSTTFATPMPRSC